MNTVGKATLLYLSVYALDFGTSACFIMLGFGYVETNQFQRALLATPTLGSLLPWATNQALWIALGVLGPIVWLRSWSPARGATVSTLLALLSFFRLYGVASNLGFMAGVAFGVPLSALACFALLSVPMLGAFRNELWATAGGWVKHFSVSHHL